MRTPTQTDSDPAILKHCTRCTRNTANGPYGLCDLCCAAISPGDVGAEFTTAGTFDAEMARRKAEVP